MSERDTVEYWKTRALAVEADIASYITAARSEGFAAGEASMRERAAGILHSHAHDASSDAGGAEQLGDDPEAINRLRNYAVDIERLALRIEALPPSSPAVWTAEVKSLANGERDG